jgi:hypothetical protein
MRQWLVLDTSRLQQVGPLAAGCAMTVLEMLPKVVGSEELLVLVALAELVHIAQVFGARLPVRRVVGKQRTAVATHVRPGMDALGRCMRMKNLWLWRKSCAWPWESAEVQRVLVTFGFVLVLESVRTVGALILFFAVVEPETNN